MIDRLKYATVFLIPMLFGLPMAFAQFNDVPQTHDYYTGIDYVRSEGIVAGYEDGSFRPDNTINRAEFTKIVVESQFEEAAINACNTSGFSDVPEGVWFTNYVCLAKNSGYIGGYPDGTFQPNQNISFVEAAKILSKSFQFPSQQGDPWFETYVDNLGHRDAIPLTIRGFDHAITRGEMAEMVWRLRGGIRTKSTHTYDSLRGEDEPNIKEGVQTVDIPDEMVESEKAMFINYSKAAYDQAIADDKVIFVFYYANWCPLCRRSLPEIEAAFEELEGNVVGFLVHYNDNETTDEHEDLARKHGVGYHDTKVIVKGGERVIKSPAFWDKAKVIEEITNQL